MDKYKGPTETTAKLFLNKETTAQQSHQMQQQHMGYSGDGGGGGGGGGGLGLTRFRSAPATSLDILLQDNELTQNQVLAQLSANTSTSPPIIRNSANYSPSDAEPSFFGTNIGNGTGITTATGFGFFRQNSSPAELLAQLDSPSGFGCDGYFTNSGISANNRDSDKRGKELELKQEADFSSQLKEEYSVQLPSRMNSFSDMEMDKLFEDSVPCRIRAKRGCATHPRSIAERVRRTRISDRIRKLQELVPNMDKQTNTADMLEEAVEYVKLLQNQIQELSEHQKKCKCIDRD